MNYWFIGSKDPGCYSFSFIVVIITFFFGRSTLKKTNRGYVGIITIQALFTNFLTDPLFALIHFVPKGLGFILAPISSSREWNQKK